MKGDKIYYREGYKYQLAKSYTIQTEIYLPENISTSFIFLSKTGLLLIKEGYAWDGPSGPTIDTPSSMRGSLVHDALYQLMRLGLISEDNRDYADLLLKKVCVEDGMNKVRAKLWQTMVNLFASGCAKSGTGREVKEAP